MSTDCSGHWYIVPVNKSKAWEQWVSMDEDDPDSWKPPAFAKMISRPENITFTDPK